MRPRTPKRGGFAAQRVASVRLPQRAPTVLTASYIRRILLRMERRQAHELLRWREDAAGKLKDAEATLAEAQRRVEECRERVRLLDRLLVVEGVPSAPAADDHAGGNGDEPPRERDDLLDACERVVREAGRPLHISELHAALLNQRIPVPGRGTQANLLVRLHRSNGRFVRTGRGTYAPASLGAQEVRPTVRRRFARRAR